MLSNQSEFTRHVLEAFDNRNTVFASGTRGPLAKSQTSLPPELRHLSLGDRVTRPVANVFIDLREFTARSFWDDPGLVADLADAVLSGVAMVVEDMGGWVVGLRGDGLYAVFGLDPFVSEQLSILTAAACCARALSEVRDNLNPWLTARGIEPVRVRAGADYGPVVFIRSGTNHASEVNPVGFAANFASKCEKYALAWEVVVGERFAGYLGTATTRHDKSPKVYQRGAERHTYNFYDFSWERLVSALPGFADDIRAVTQDAVR